MKPSELRGMSLDELRGQLADEQRGLYNLRFRKSVGEDINATFVSDPFNTQFVFTTEKRDTSYFTTAIGVVTLLPGGFTAYLQNETYLQMDNYKQSVWSLGARMEF